MTTEEKLNSLFQALVAAAKRDPTLMRDIEALFGESVLNAPRARETGSRDRTTEDVSRPARAKTRRSQAVLDPFVVYEESPSVLTERLHQFDLEKLRDIVAEYGMDPAKLVIKWKAPQRIIDHILETVQARLRKGDAFRA